MLSKWNHTSSAVTVFDTGILVLQKDLHFHFQNTISTPRLFKILKLISSTKKDKGVVSYQIVGAVQRCKKRLE